MSEFHFKDQEQATHHLSLHPPGTWIVEEEDDGWVTRALTFKERSERKDFANRAVTVTFQTVADLLREEMTDEDWIATGKMVADAAAQQRSR